MQAPTVAIPSTSAASQPIPATFPSTSTMSKLTVEREVRDQLDAELRVLEKATPIISGEDEELVELIKELYKLEMENEKLAAEKEESDEEVEATIDLLQQDYHKQQSFWATETSRFDNLESQRQKELGSLQSKMEKLQMEIRQVEEENEGAKMGVLGPMSLRKQGEVMVLFGLKRHEELAKDGMARMQEGEKEAESTQESVQLLQEMCDEHFRPKELKQQVEENTLALEVVFMDMEIDKENRPPPSC